MADTEVKTGDQVAWNWSGSKPGGEAAEVKAGEVSVTSHRGNEIKKSGDENDPAVHIARPGNDVVKKASELEVQKEGPEHSGGSSEKKGEEPKADGAKTDGGLKPDEKHAKGKSKSKSPQPPAATAAPTKEEPKKQEKPAANGEKKKPGRPKANGSGPSAKKADKPKKRAATETGEPRRSKRNKSS